MFFSFLLSPCQCCFIVWKCISTRLAFALSVRTIFQLWFALHSNSLHSIFVTEDATWRIDWLNFFGSPTRWQSSSLLLWKMSNQSWIQVRSFIRIVQDIFPQNVTCFFYFTKKKFNFAKLVTLFVVWNIENMLDLWEGGGGVNETLYRA